MRKMGKTFNLRLIPAIFSTDSLIVPLIDCSSFALVIFSTFSVMLGFPVGSFASVFGLLSDELLLLTLFVTPLASGGVVEATTDVFCLNKN